jgi:hypothetical protein
VTGTKACPYFITGWFWNLLKAIVVFDDEILYLGNFVFISTVVVGSLIPNSLHVLPSV